jgi:hypothetical protein
MKLIPIKTVTGDDILTVYTFKEWIRKYKPIANIFDDYFFDGEPGLLAALLETDVRLNNINPNNLWTKLSEDGKYFIIPGKHFINRMAYCVTEIPHNFEAITVTVPKMKINRHES